VDAAISMRTQPSHAALIGALWQDRIKLHAAKMEKQSKEKEVQLQELEEIAPMGSGAFGLVTLVRHRPTGHTYALKAVNKQYLQKTRTGELLKREVSQPAVAFLSFFLFSMASIQPIPTPHLRVGALLLPRATRAGARRC
jgi:hypothetical protein